MRRTAAAARLARFRTRQGRFFREADEEHFRWQTEAAHFAQTERDLLSGFPLPPAAAVLEVGCGEGGNLRNLLRTPGASPRVLVGIDLFERKVRFASRQSIDARFVCGDALRLPFRDDAFDVILCRDVLHHLDDPAQALHELERVAKPEATVWIVEPNGRNPLILLMSLVRPHERGQLRNSVASVRELAARHFRSIHVEVRQPLPLERVLLHPRLGFSALGRSGIVARSLNAWHRLCRVAWPRGLWAYIVVKATGKNVPSTGRRTDWHDETAKG
jgi:SAM-dependent methyltransferase